LSITCRVLSASAEFIVILVIHSSFILDFCEVYILLQVIYRVKLSVDDEGRLDIFTSFPPDPVHRGSLQLRTGSVIGLPSNFYYQTVGDVGRNSILVGQEMVDWNSSAGKELQNALVLSDKAKAFVIAREFFRAKSFTVHVDTLLQLCCLVFAYYSGAWLNYNMLLTMRLKPWARFIVFSTIGVAGLSLYIMISDASHCWYDNRVDEAAAKLRKIYAEGGVEYYEKVLQRNCALRRLLGLKGAKQFTRYGNVVSLWRNRSVQLTSRHDNLVKYLAEYEHEETVVQPDDDINEEQTVS